ncbi:MAG: 5-formyltetrahydrofolate cyclo-ligase [Mahellales bacterium]|jgi:5-formyltetrahydrofolate cyclo-ligase
MMDKTGMDKDSIREKVLRVRNNLTPDQIRSMSLDIFNTFINLDQAKGSSTIMIFLSFGSEVITDNIIEWAWQTNKKVAVPICRPKTREMVPSIIDSFDQVKPGYFGIRQPKEELVRPIDKNEIDLIVVPSVAFDKNGYRVGYGGGYYDRFLADIKKDVPKIGIAFDCQVVSRVPTDEYDIPVDLIVTNNGIIDTGKK